MTNKNKKKSTKHNLRYPYLTPINQACTVLLTEHTMKTNDHKMISGIQYQCRRSGFISHSQARQIGRLYKLHVNKGEYVHHDWWPTLQNENTNTQ